MCFKNLITFLFILSASQLDGQVQHALSFVLNPDTESEVTYVYPEETPFEVANALGNQLSIEIADKTVLSGQMTVTVQTPWNEQADILRASEGLTIKYSQYEVPSKVISDEHSTAPSSTYGAYTGSVRVTEKEIIEEGEEFGIRISFNNGIAFTLINGEASAYQNSHSIPITGNYKIQSAEGVLYLSFNRQTAEAWYFFEPKA
ncbi:MAG: hypothetical protein AAGF87_05735 [Bacteroidota bacterium]